METYSLTNSTILDKVSEGVQTLLSNSVSYM